MTANHPKAACNPAPSAVPGALLALALLMSAVSPLRAQDASSTAGIPTQDSTFGVSASLGILNGEAREHVFDAATGARVSRLDWDFGNAAMFTAAASYTPSSWFSFALKGSTNLSATSKMADYDWNTGDCPSDGMGGDFCASFHPGTRLVSAHMLDASVRFAGLTLGPSSLAPIAGFKWEHFSWRAYNGTSNYAGAFDDGLGISYEQRWRTPYIGIAFASSLGPLDISARGVFSNWGQGDDRDHHHSRSLIFKESFDDVRMFGVDLGLRYALSQRVAVTLDYSLTRWKLEKAPGFITDLSAGVTDYDPGDATGASNTTQIVSLGMSVDLSPRSAWEPVAAEGGDAREAPSDWSGPYAGATASMLWHGIDWQTQGAANGTRPARASFDTSKPGGAMFAGWSWQHGAIVWGGEAEAGRASGDTYHIGIPGTAPPAALAASPDSVVIEHGWNGSLRLRGGLLLTPAMLAYVTGGFAYEHQYAFMSCSQSGSWCVADGNEKHGEHLTGWTLGGGLDVLMGPNAFVRAEYRYSDLGSYTHTFFNGADAVPARVETSDQRLSVGAGVRF